MGALFSIKSYNMKREKSFNNFKHNGLHLTFPNGNFISTIFGIGSYTENHDMYTKMEEFMDSNDVEIMFDCGDKLKKKILKKYNDGENDPI